MAESTESEPPRNEDFWITKPNDCLTSDNNFGGLSVWLDKDHIWSLECNVRVGDQLEFMSSKLPCKHWGIYIDELNFLPWNVVYFIPDDVEGRSYSDMKTCLNVSFPSSHHALVVNTIYTLVSMPGGKVRINNLKDTDCSPLCTEYICKEISYQLKELHKRSVFEQVSVYRCRVPFNDSEDFVNYCRYDRGSQHCRCLLNCEKVTEWHSKANIKHLIREVRVGDRLEFRRKSPHNHWGIYIGQWGKELEQVVHFIPSHENTETKLAMTSAGFGSSARNKPELCVESIRPVLRDDEVRINNERDRTWPPLVGKDILDEINRQLLGKTHMYACKVSFKKSEDCVNYFRYDYWRINFDELSAWGSSLQSLPRLHVGDKLEFSRTALPYTQWGIYVGDWGDDHHQVVHLAPANGNGKIFSKKKTLSSGSSVEGKPVLCVDNIFEVLGNDKFRINNSTDKTWPPLVRTDILDEINRQLPGTTHRYACNILFKDGEDFVNYCRYDDRRINFRFVSGWCDSWLSLPLLHVGDRLECDCTARLNSHWGIYVGDWENDRYQVVHLAPAADGKGEIFSRKKSVGSSSSAKDKPVVCVESIWEFLGNDKVKINNEKDQTWPPLASIDILDVIKTKLPNMTHRYGSKFSFKNSEDFVNYCRYDDWRANFGLVSDWCDDPQSMPWMVAGDRLEFSSTALTYSHWGIYVGKLWGKSRHQVVHFCPTFKKIQFFSLKRHSGSVRHAQSIWEVLETDKVRINNERDQTWPPVATTNTLEEFQRQLKSQFACYKSVYHLFSNNCEHFVNHCRYGTHHSEQMEWLPSWIKTAFKLSE